MKAIAVVAAAAAILGAGPAHAEEVWLGLLAHDVTFLGEAAGVGASGREEGMDVELGWRSAPIEAWGPIGSPRGYVFVSGNDSDDTSFVAAGFSWGLDFGRPGGWSIRPGLGLAVHDGYEELPDFRDPTITPEERARRLALRNEHTQLGAKLLFQPELVLRREIGDLGALELAYVHLSHGQILGSGMNQGLDNVGLRFVHRFGG